MNDLYNSASDLKIEQNWQRAEKLVEELKTYRGKITKLNSTELLALIQKSEKLQIIVSRIGLYASLLESTHIGAADVTRFSKQVNERAVALSTQIIFIDIEFSQLSEEQWQLHLKAPELQAYLKHLEMSYRLAKHILTEAEEKILTEKSQTSSQALNHLYSVTTDTLEFKWDSKIVTLEEIISKFHDADPAIRKQAAMVLHGGLEQNKKTSPPILNALVQDKSISDRLRHHQYPEEARFMGDDVDSETVEAMVEAVNRSIGMVERYYKVKKKLMGVKELYWWDRYAPLPNTKAVITMDQARRMVAEAFTEFSPEMAAIAQEMGDRQHIDWLPSPTKRGGAFCAYGEKGDYPYVLLNYTDQPRDVMTLAHELGHAIHNVLADRENVYFQTNSSLALAEIASVFGETLLFEKLTQSGIGKDDKIALLMSFIEDRFATAFRQTSMFQFEQQLHSKRRNEGELSKEEIDELWDSTMKKPFESALTYTPEHKNSWMYVGHIFHWPFYVYSYSFAQLCVLALYSQYKEQGQAFVPTYLKILRAGGSLSPKDNLKQAGLDISQPEFWADGLAVIEGFIDQLEKLVSDPSDDKQT